MVDRCMCNDVNQAMDARIELPAEAQPRVLSPNLRLEWTDHLASLASNWHDFNDEGWLRVFHQISMVEVPNLPGKLDVMHL